MQEITGVESDIIPLLNSKALNLHVRYARFDSKLSNCVARGLKLPSPNYIDIPETEKRVWEFVEDTLFLYPFLKLLVKKMGGRNGYSTDYKDVKYAKLNWIGDPSLKEEFILAEDYLSTMKDFSAEIPERAKIAQFRMQHHLYGLKLVLSHMGSSAVKPMTLWVERELAQSMAEKSDLLKQILIHLNTCSVKGVRVKDVNGEKEYYSWSYYYKEGRGFVVQEGILNPGNLMAYIKQMSENPPIVALHKQTIVDVLTDEEYTTLLEYANIQAEYMNDFIFSVR